MPVSLYKFPDYARGKALMGCTCGQLICEIDTINCAQCGDICCEECYTDCTHCGKMFCLNCSDNRFECTRCSVELNMVNSKAFILIGEKTFPVKNSAQMFQLVKGRFEPKSYRLNLNGELYDYKYRSIALRNDSQIYDYFFTFEPSEKQIIEVNGKKIIV